VNRLQLLASVCLVLLSILSSVSSAFRSAGFDPKETGSLQTLGYYTNWAMFVLLFPVPLYCGHGFVSALWAYK
jgi:hypothetical protein